MTEIPCSIGSPGVPWSDSEKVEWLADQAVQRTVADQVYPKVEQLRGRFEIFQYGALSIDPKRYPLYVVRSLNWSDEKPTLLLTGGVHGYETSGVQGALRYLHDHGAIDAERINILSAPCISPWGYETTNRWNPKAIDPNRSFHADSPSEEAAHLMAYLKEQGHQFDAHIDLHETTDTDNTTFRPALAARDGVHHDNWHIPDGFYTVDDAAKPTPDFQRTIIEAVEQVTHVAVADEHGCIIGESQQQHGVIEYAARKLGLCMGMTDARFVTTTEVYPDSPKVDDEICILAQVATVRAAVTYLLAQQEST